MLGTKVLAKGLKVDLACGETDTDTLETELVSDEHDNLDKRSIAVFLFEF